MKTYEVQYHQFGYQNSIKFDAKNRTHMYEILRAYNIENENIDSIEVIGSVGSDIERYKLVLEKLKQLVSESSYGLKDCTTVQMSHSDDGDNCILFRVSLSEDITSIDGSLLDSINAISNKDKVNIARIDIDICHRNLDIILD